MLPEKSCKQISIANLQLLCHNNNWQYMTILEKSRNSSHEFKNSESSCEEFKKKKGKQTM